jgi:hypothetical protein
MADTDISEDENLVENGEKAVHETPVIEEL